MVGKIHQKAYILSVCQNLEASFNKVVSAHGWAFQCVKITSEKDVADFYHQLLMKIELLNQQDLTTLYDLNKKLKNLSYKREIYKYEACCYADALIEKINQLSQKLPKKSLGVAEPIESDPTITINANRAINKAEDFIGYVFLPVELQEMIMRFMRIGDLYSFSCVDRAMGVRSAQLLIGEFQKIIQGLKTSDDALIEEIRQALEFFKNKPNPENYSAKLAWNLTIKIFGFHFPHGLRLNQLAAFVLQIHQSARRQQKDIRQYVELLNTIGVGKVRYADLMKFSNDPIIIKAAVAKNGQLLEYASQKLKNDEQIVKTAVKQCYWSLLYAGYKLRDNERIVRIAISKSYRSLRLASARLCGSREIIEMALDETGMALQYADKALQNDREIVEIAVSQNGWALEYASKELCGDKKIVAIALADNGLIIHFASEELRGNKEIMKQAVMKTPRALEFATGKLKNNPQMRKLAGWSTLPILKRIKNKFL